MPKSINPVNSQANIPRSYHLPHSNMSYTTTSTFDSMLATMFNTDVVAEAQPVFDDLFDTVAPAEPEFDINTLLAADAPQFEAIVVDVCVPTETEFNIDDLFDEPVAAEPQASLNLDVVFADFDWNQLSAPDTTEAVSETVPGMLTLELSPAQVCEPTIAPQALDCPVQPVETDIFASLFEDPAFMAQLVESEFAAHLFAPQVTFSGLDFQPAVAPAYVASAPAPATLGDDAEVIDLTKSPVIKASSPNPRKRSRATKEALVISDGQRRVLLQKFDNSAELSKPGCIVHPINKVEAAVAHFQATLPEGALSRKRPKKSEVEAEPKAKAKSKMTPRKRALQALASQLQATPAVESAQFDFTFSVPLQVV